MAARLMGVSPTPLHHWTMAFNALPVAAAGHRGHGRDLAGGTPVFPAASGWLVRGGALCRQHPGSRGRYYAHHFCYGPSPGFYRHPLYARGSEPSLRGGDPAGPARREERRPVILALVGVPVPASLAMVLFFTGLLGIGYEVLVVRVISQVLENTIYSFAGVLSVYLFGTVAARRSTRNLPPGISTSSSWQPSSSPWPPPVLPGLSCCGLPLLYIRHKRISGKQHMGIGAWGGNPGGGGFFIPPCAWAPRSATWPREPGAQWGPGERPWVEHPGVGPGPGSLWGSVPAGPGGQSYSDYPGFGYVVLALPWLSARRWAAVVPLALAAVLLFIPGPLRLVDLPPGGKIVAHREGVMAAVTVVQDGRERFLKVNNHFVMGGTASYFSDARQALIPLLLHPDPQGPVLGLGTGITASGLQSFIPVYRPTAWNLFRRSCRFCPFSAGPLRVPWTGSASRSSRPTPAALSMPETTNTTSSWPTCFTRPGTAPVPLTPWSTFRP